MRPNPRRAHDRIPAPDRPPTRSLECSLAPRVALLLLALGLGLAWARPTAARPPPAGLDLLDLDPLLVTQLHPEVRDALDRWYQLRPCDPGSSQPDSPSPGTGFLVCATPVAGGTFLRGAQRTEPKAAGFDPDALPEEGPPRSVTVKPFLLEQSEVVEVLYAACRRAGACLPGDQSSSMRAPRLSMEFALLPVRGVTWEGADRYCRWVGGRLPTEDEWERAARGHDGRRFPWGDTPLPVTQVVVSNELGPQPVVVEDLLHPADGPFGHRGLAGNVWEWVDAWFFPPAGPGDAGRRVQRGGAYDSDYPVDFRAARRVGLMPLLQLDDVGFRCALSSAPPDAPTPASPGRSPFAGRWTPVDQADRPAASLRIDAAGRLLVPGGLGRVTADGRVSLFFRDQLIVGTGQCIRDRCDVALRSIVVASTARFVMRRAR